MISPIPNLNPKPCRVLYIYAVVVVALFLMAFMWLIFYASISQIRGAITSTMIQYDTNGSAYGSFELADAFMSNLWAFFLVVVFFGLLLWVYHYAQRKGQPVYVGG